MPCYDQYLESFILFINCTKCNTVAVDNEAQSVCLRVCCDVLALPSLQHPWVVDILNPFLIQFVMIYLAMNPVHTTLHHFSVSLYCWILLSYKHHGTYVICLPTSLLWFHLLSHMPFDTFRLSATLLCSLFFYPSVSPQFFFLLFFNLSFPFHSVTSSSPSVSPILFFLLFSFVPLSLLLSLPLSSFIPRQLMTLHDPSWSTHHHSIKSTPQSLNPSPLHAFLSDVCMHSRVVCAVPIFSHRAKARS